MERLQQLIREIHRRSLWQVLAIYVATSAAVLGGAGTLADVLRLPDWFVPLAFGLLIVGMPIVLATAFLQEGLPGAGEAQGAVGAAKVGGGDEVAGASVPPATLFTWRNALFGGVGAFAVIGVIAMGLVVLPSEEAGAREPVLSLDDGGTTSLAVLPFLVSGGELEEWEEGLADLVSTNLDGTGPLRSVDTRTVLAQWDRVVGDIPNPDLATALSVAEATGARFALEGSVAAIGGEARLVIRIHDLETGTRLGTGQVDGSLDSPQDLVDKLTVEIMRLLFGGDAADLPPIDLAGVTTTSPQALRAYVRGQQAHRRGRLDEAVEAFREAVDIDSMFALAYHQIDLACGWGGAAGCEVRPRARERLEELADRIPERERFLLRSRRNLVRSEDDPSVLESPVLEAARLYRNDAEVLYTLADIHLHSDYAIISAVRVEELFGQAIELDPGFAAFRSHHVQQAFELHYDSALARRRVSEFRAVLGDPVFPAFPAVPQSFNPFWLQQYEGSLRLIFGSPGVQAAALDSLTAWGEQGRLGRVWQMLNGNPYTLPLSEAVDRTRLGLARGTPEEALRLQYLGRTLANQGKIAEALEILEQPALVRSELGYRACLVEEYLLMGLPVGAEVVRTEAAQAGDPAGNWRNASCGSYLAADLGLRSEFEAGQERLRSLADTIPNAERAWRISDVYWEWRQGGRTGAELARALLSVGHHTAAPSWAFWLGEIYRESGMLREAEEAYLATYNLGRTARYTVMWYQLAGIYEQLGERGKARDAWERVLAAWDDPDEDVRPRVDEARARLAELGG